MTRSNTPTLLGPLRARCGQMVLHARGWSPESRDAVLYGGSAMFAGLTVAVSGFPLYREWGMLAIGPYAAGAIFSGILAHRRAPLSSGDDASAGRQAPSRVAHGGRGRETGVASEEGDTTRWRHPNRHWSVPRIAVFLLVLFGSTLLPLALEVSWRADSSNPAAHVQPEVTDVENAGGRLATHQDPYQQVDRHDHLIIRAPGQPAWEPYFPYLPAMAAFGLARSTHAPPQLTDARVLFSLTTLLLVALAIGLSRGPDEPKVRALQVLTVLPTAALPLATGGDDMPVVACLFLAMVLLQRRRPMLAGAVMGVASSLKFTAWPLAALSLLGARDAAGRRASIRMAIGMAAVVAPLVLPTALWNPGAFVDNAVKFPLGLAAVSSPAASALPGHLFVTAFPALHRAYTIVVGVAGLLFLVQYLCRRPIRGGADAARIGAWVMAVAIVLAPATRVGYLLYPVNLYVWAWMFRKEDRAIALPDPGLQPSLAQPSLV